MTSGMNRGTRTRTHISLPEKLVDDIDELVGKRNRSRFIAEAAEKELKRKRLLRTIKRGAGILKAEDYPEWSTPEKVVEWVRAQRRIPSSFEKRYGPPPRES